MPVLKFLNTIVSGLQVIYDLLERSSGHLELRKDPDQGITVAGLKRIKVILWFQFKVSIRLLFESRMLVLNSVMITFIHSDWHKFGCYITRSALRRRYWNS